MKRLLFSLVILLVSTNSWATDFTIGIASYTITNSSTHTVSIGTGGLDPAISINTSGVFSIPSSVSYGGITYSVTGMSRDAFRGCNKLTSVTIPNSITKISSGAFFDCAGLTSFTLPNSVVSIGGSAFMSCTGLTSFTFSNSLTSIGIGTFQNCPGLTSISLPNSLTTIGDYAFAFCSGLTSVTIPGTVTSIGTQAFKECSALSSIYLKNSNPSAIALGEYLFYLSPVSTCKLYVPAGSKSAYQVAYQWSDFANNTMEEGKNALHFDGANDYVAIPPVATNLNTFTIEMWIKPNSVPATGDIALLNTNSWDGTNGSSVHFQMEGSKVLISVYGITTGWPSSNYTPVVNTWQHIAVTYDRPNNSVRFYINGVLVSTVNKTLPVAKIDAACIGAWGATQRFFNGAIDEVRIWSTLRTGKEIADNKDTLLSNPATIPDLLAYYDFNQGVADGDNTSIPVLLDGSASELNGTLNNFAKTGATSNFVKGFPILNLSAATASVMAFAGSTATVNVTSTTSWTAASDQSWLTVSPESGTDNGTLTFTATENSTASTRTATVTVSATGTVTKSIAVTQTANYGTGIVSPGKETLTFSPNPTQKGFTINAGDKESILSIYDLSGSLILTKQISGKSYIDVAALPSGIYMVKANGIVGKLIKK